MNEIPNTEWHSFKSINKNGVIYIRKEIDYTLIIKEWTRYSATNCTLIDYETLPTTWTYKYIDEVQKPDNEKTILSQLKIINNEPGEAKVSKYNEEQFIFSEPIISGSEYVINGEMFSAITNTINIEYESNQWCSNGGCFVFIVFDGEGISPKIYSENGVIIDEMENGFRIVGQTNGSCSGSVICDINDKHIIINIIFKGIPY